MKTSYQMSTRVVGLAFLAGLWATACSLNNNSDKGAGGAVTKGGSTSSSTGSGGTTGTSPAQNGGATTSSTGGTTGTSPAQNGGATSSSTGGTTDTSPAQTGGATSSNTGGTTTQTGGATSGSTGGTTGTSPAQNGGATSSSTGGTTGTGTAQNGGATSSSTGGTTGTAQNGGATSTGTTTAVGGGGASGTTSTGTTCPIIWDWEGTTADSWITDADVTLAVSTTQKFTGTQSLKATIPALTSTAGVDGGAAATSTVRGLYIKPPSATSNMWPGATVTAHVWVPTGTTGVWMQLFTQSNNWAVWKNSPTTMATAGAWTTLTWTVPAATDVFPGGINQFALQLGVSGGNSFAGGDIFIDSITVCGGTQSCSGTGAGSFDFETAGSTDGWAFKGDTAITDTVVTQSTAQHYGSSGSGSLKVAMTAIPVAPTIGWTSRLAELANPQAYCGQTVTYHVMADNVTGLNVQPYASANGWGWFPGTGVTLTAINTWTTVTFTVPPTINFLGLQAMGLMLSNTSTSGTYTGNVYIDGVTWQ